jgi:lipopolysaccharide export system permease protein
MYYRLIPYTHALMRSMFLDDVEESLYAVLERDHSFNQPRMDYAVWVRQVQGRKLINALFKRRDKENMVRYDTVAWAREAELRVDMSRRVIVLHMLNARVSVDGGSFGYFQDRFFEVDLPQAFLSDRPRRPRDLSWQEMRERRREVVEKENEVVGEIGTTMAQATQQEAPPDLRQHLDELHTKKKFTHIEVFALDTEMQMRPALSFGCLCFVLVGCPVGIWFSRSDYLSAFITCFLPVVFVYYPLMLCGTNLAKEGKFNALVSVWAADVLVALAGLVLFKRLLRN